MKRVNTLGLVGGIVGLLAAGMLLAAGFLLEDFHVATLFLGGFSGVLLALLTAAFSVAVLVAAALWRANPGLSKSLLLILGAAGFLVLGWMFAPTAALAVIGGFMKARAA